MIRNVFHALLIFLVIVLSLYNWDLVSLTYEETTIIGEYFENKYNHKNDLLRYLVFVSLPLLSYILIKSLNFSQNYQILKDRILNQDIEFINNNNFLNILTIFFVSLTTLEFLSINFPMNKIDIFHEGQQMSSAFKHSIDQSLWSGSYVTVGIFYETISSNLIWKFFDHLSIGSTRYLNLIYIFLLKLILIIIFYQITILSKLSYSSQLCFNFLLNLSGFQLINYIVGVDNFIWREIFPLLTLLFFLQIFLRPDLKKFIVVFAGPISALSIFWSVDRGIVCNLILVILMFYLFIKKDLIPFINLIFSIIFTWIAFYFYLGNEFHYFLVNTLSILREMNIIGGIIHPIPFSDDPNSARAAKTLILILISIIISLELIFLKKVKIENKFIFSLILISVFSFLSYGYAIGRSDGPHIKSTFGFVQIFYSVIVFYFIITYLDKINILNKILLHKTKIFFLIVILSVPNFNLNIQNILNFNERLNKYTNLDDSFFLDKKQVMFVSNAKEIVKEYECVQLFTNSVMLLYLLRKPSCSIFYFTITVGSKKNQIKFNKLMSNTQIVISDTYKNEFSPAYRLKYTNKYIQDNYENIYEEDVWIIKKRLN
tara:strand:- start:1119 stop:2918 length:1800 start_codon:yes stop_codon:yes gene_type:complete